MKARGESKGPPTADLLVCFPSRAHFSLMPKPICSPARPPRHHRRPSHHQLPRKSGGGGATHGSPLLWATTNQGRRHNSADVSEPTSPKVTCAGQIKVRTKPSSCKNWQSVMEEIERLHHNRKNKRAAWIEAFGLKKEVMQFLTCLRHLRFDFRCFGGADVTSDEEDDEDEDEDEDGSKEDDQGSKAVFSKWFMILDEEPPPPPAVAAPPPRNALLLMRCRSAPAKSWLEEREEEERERREKEKVEEGKTTDLSEFCGEIGKEIQEKISRCRSWKR